MENGLTCDNCNTRYSDFDDNDVPNHKPIFEAKKSNGEFTHICCVPQEDLGASLTWRKTNVYTAVGEYNMATMATMYEQPKKKQKKVQLITAEHPIAPMPVQQAMIQGEAAVHLPDRHVHHRATHTPISERLKRLEAAIQVEEPVHPIASKTSGSTAPVELSNAENVGRGRKRERPTEADLEDNDDATTTAEHGQPQVMKRTS